MQPSPTKAAPAGLSLASFDNAHCIELEVMMELASACMARALALYGELARYKTAKRRIDYIIHKTDARDPVCIERHVQVFRRMLRFYDRRLSGGTPDGSAH